MSSPTPVVSVIIPTYNRSARLRPAVLSALSAVADPRDLEIIIADDHSPDDTPTVCRELEAEFPAVRGVRLQKNGGAGAARNAGIAAARGEFLAFLDDDDWRLPGSLDAQIQRLREVPEAIFCYGPVRFAESISGEYNGVVYPEDLPEGDIFWRLAVVNFPQVPSVVVRRSLLKDRRVFSPHESNLADWDAWLRLAHDHPVVAVPDPVAGYRLPNPRSGQLSSSAAATALDAARLQKQLLATLPRPRADCTRARTARAAHCAWSSEKLYGVMFAALAEADAATVRAAWRAMLRLRPRFALRRRVLRAWLASYVPALLRVEQQPTLVGQASSASGADAGALVESYTDQLGHASAGCHAGGNLRGDSTGALAPDLTRLPEDGSARGGMVPPAQLALAGDNAGAGAGDTSSRVALTVLIPTFNRCELLPGAVQSAVDAAAGAPFAVDICIVDDCSTDNTPDVCSELQAHFTNVRYVRLNRNGGLAGARNSGLSATNSTYVALLDDDDLRLPGSFAAQVNALQAQPEAALCYGKVRLANADMVPTGELQPVLARGGDLFWELLEENFIRVPSVVLRRDALERIGGFDASLRRVEDQDRWVRLAHDYPFVAVDEPVAIYRQCDVASGQLSGDHAAMAATSARLMRRWLALPRAVEAPAAKRRRVQRAFADKQLALLRSTACQCLGAGMARAARRDLVMALRLNPLGALRRGIPRLWLRSFFPVRQSRATTAAKTKSGGRQEGS